MLAVVYKRATCSGLRVLSFEFAMYRCWAVWVVCGLVFVCGQELEPGNPRSKRLLHGSVADITAHPHQVALLRKQKQVHCGGTLVRPDVVFTAAHCTHPNNVQRSDLSVLVGANGVRDPRGRIHEIRKIIKHPEFYHGGFDKDFAVVFLEKPVEINERARPIGISLQDHAPGAKGYVTGWGLTEFGKPSKDLRVISQTVENLEKCRDYFPKVNHPPITENMICAKPGRMSSHFGDSGGPFIINGKLAGIVSFGRPVSSDKKITVYTKVKSVIDFINDVVPNYS